MGQKGVDSAGMHLRRSTLNRQASLKENNILLFLIILSFPLLLAVGCSESCIELLEIEWNSWCYICVYMDKLQVVL